MFAAQRLKLLELDSNYCGCYVHWYGTICHLRRLFRLGEEDMSDVHRHIEHCTLIDVGDPPSSEKGDKWKSFQFNIHGFDELPSGRGQLTLSPEFMCAMVINGD